MASDNQAVSTALTANKYTKPVLSMQIIDVFRTYAWAALGELVTNGITPFNITFAIKSSMHAVTLKVSHLVTVESEEVVMSFADAQEFQQSVATFPATNATCGHCLTTHSMLVDLMMGVMALFAMA